ncbi:MAG: ribosome assembly RNA-binding protein YhbY [Deltaproteobacteria bacterium]|nr:ribosome assembly RNA-binding protein YhbY [Deltaproteobacteria bacterium]
MASDSNTHDLPQGTAPRLPATDLRGVQRKHLRGLAHHLDPIVHLGKEGVSEALIDAVSMALEQHELIKLKVLEAAPLPRKQAAVEVATAVGAHVAGQLGRVVILYRRHPEEPRITLPR